MGSAHLTDTYQVENILFGPLSVWFATDSYSHLDSLSVQYKAPKAAFLAFGHLTTFINAAVYHNHRRQRSKYEGQRKETKEIPESAVSEVCQVVNKVVVPMRLSSEPSKYPLPKEMRRESPIRHRIRKDGIGLSFPRPGLVRHLFDLGGIIEKERLPEKLESIYILLGRVTRFTSSGECCRAFT